jgi:5-methylcytosine-specific restriction endonuclease McrA
MRYNDYLKSKDWREKKTSKHNRKGGLKKRCAICGSREKLDVHHLSYKKELQAVEQKDLRIFCRRCHYLAHKLFKEGKIVFKNDNHHSRFALTKNAIKRELGLKQENLFYPSD